MNLFHHGALQPAPTPPQLWSRLLYARLRQIGVPVTQHDVDMSPCLWQEYIDNYDLQNPPRLSDVQTPHQT